MLKERVEPIRIQNSSFESEVENYI